MATLKIWNVNVRYDNTLRYICKPEKTGNGKYISAIQCPADRKLAYYQMERTKDHYGKTGGVLAYHFVQSFKKGEVSAEEAHRIGLEYAQRVFGGHYEMVITTHVDTGKIHNHFVFNSVSHVDGLKYHDGGKHNLEYLRRANDEICLAHNLSIIKEPKREKYKTYNVIEQEKQGNKSIRTLIREDIDEAILQAGSLQGLLSTLKKMDYEVRTAGKYLSVRPFGSDKFFRLYKLGKEYSEEEIIKRIQARRSPTLKTGAQLPPKAYKQNVKVKSSYARYIRRHKRYTGLIGAYLQYRNTLKRVQKNKYSYHPSLYMRDDVQKLRSYSDQAMLLVRYKISTLPQLRELKKAFKDSMNRLNNQRQEIRIQLRDITDDKNISRLQGEIDRIKEQIRPIYRDIKLVEEIEKHYPEVQQKNMKEREKTEKEKIIERLEI